MAFLAVAVSAFASLSPGCGGSQGVAVVAFPGPLEVCYRQDDGGDPVVRYPEFTHHGTGSFGLWTAMSSKSSRTSGAVSDDVRAYEFDGEWIRRLTIISAGAPYAADGGELPIVVLDFERWNVEWTETSCIVRGLMEGSGTVIEVSYTLEEGRVMAMTWSVDGEEKVRRTFGY